MSEVSKYGLSDDWYLSEEHPGCVVKTVVYKNVTCEIIRPILDPAEKARREKQAMHNIAKTMMPYLARKERTNA